MPDSPIARLVDDVLHDIFLLLRDNDDKQRLSRWITVGTLVSRVSLRWRAIASRDSSLWKDIFIGPTSSPGLTRTVLKRTVKHDLRVLFCVPEDMGGILFKGFSAPFSASLGLVMAQSNCWDELIVVSPYLPLLHISKMLSERPLPQLRSMKLIRSDTRASTTLSCGPFMMNADIFKHLVLDGVVIRRAHSSQFSGLWSLSVVNTDLRMLDESRTESLTCSTIPTDLAPSMTRIQHLSISAPLLPYIPCLLTFNPSTLVSLKLSKLSADMFPPYGALLSLVPKLLTENLRSLELTDIDGVVVRLLFSSLRGRKFGGLRTLKVVSTGFQCLECELEIHSIFPSLANYARV